MKNRNYVYFRSLLLVLTVCLVLVGCGTAEHGKLTTEAITEAAETADSIAEIPDEAFQCYVLDQNGALIREFYEKGEGVRYLFVPSVQDISDLIL